MQQRGRDCFESEETESRHSQGWKEVVGMVMNPMIHAPVQNDKLGPSPNGVPLGCVHPRCVH